jgi:flagellar assembly protein FliH
MKSNSTKVIKSEQVKLIKRSERTSSGQNVRGGTGKGYHTTDDAISASAMEALKRNFTQKTQAAAKEAHEKGLSEGIRQGRDLQKKDMQDSIRALGALMNEISTLKMQMLETAEEQILQLVIDVTEKVLHMEITTNPDIIRHVLKAGMKNIVDRENMKIRIHPQDYRYMMDIKSDFIRSLDGVKNIVFEEDASIARGGAMIETLFGEVDARLDHQFDRIKSVLTATAAREA